MLRGGHLVVRVLHLDTELVQSIDGVTTQVGAGVERGQIEISAMVEDLGAATVSEVEVLEFRPHVHGVAHARGLVRDLLEDVTRVAGKGLAVGRTDLAEHAGRAAGAGTPREHRKSTRVGEGQHVRLLDAGEALDRGSVKAHAFIKSSLELGGSDREALEGSQHVGEPEADKLDLLLLDDTYDVLLGQLFCHSRSFPCCAGGLRHMNTRRQTLMRMGTLCNPVVGWRLQPTRTLYNKPISYRLTMHTSKLMWSQAALHSLDTQGNIGPSAG